MSSGNSAALPYIGSKIFLISNADIRYEGILYTINTQESTIALQNVKSYGTENRKPTEARIPPSKEVYDFIIFRGRDIKDLKVVDADAASDPALHDSAILSVKRGQRSNNENDSGNSRAQGKNWQSRDGGWKSGDRSPDNRRSGGDWGFIRRPMGGNRDSGNQDSRRFTGNNRSTGNTNSGYRSGSLNRRLLVGELLPNENAETKAKVKDDFDFSQANSKFEKPSSLDDVKPASTSTTTEVDADAGENTETKETGKPTTASPEVVVRTGYNKSKSFFDDISCDAMDRLKASNANAVKPPQQQGGGWGGRYLTPAERQNRERQRRLDRETFGAFTAFPRSNNNFRRGSNSNNFNRGRGKGGYGSNNAGPREGNGMRQVVV